MVERRDVGKRRTSSALRSLVSRSKAPTATRSIVSARRPT